MTGAEKVTPETGARLRLKVALPPAVSVWVELPFTTGFEKSSAVPWSEIVTVPSEVAKSSVADCFPAVAGAVYCT